MTTLVVLRTSSIKKGPKSVTNASNISHQHQIDVANGKLYIAR